jgi:hypothetical protein
MDSFKMFSHSASLTFRFLFFSEKCRRPERSKRHNLEIQFSCFLRRNQRERLMTVVNSLTVIWVVPAPAMGEPRAARASISSKQRCDSSPEESRTRHKLDIILGFSSIAVYSSNQIVVVVISEDIFQGSSNNNSCVRTYAYFCQDNSNFWPRISHDQRVHRNNAHYPIGCEPHFPT